MRAAFIIGIVAIFLVLLFIDDRRHTRRHREWRRRNGFDA